MKCRSEHDKDVLRVMVATYCKAHHNPDGLCEKCAQLVDYACQRIEYCPLGDKKKSCRKCTIHCYAPIQRAQIRDVMRFSGAKTALSHPIMAIRHLINEIL